VNKSNLKLSFVISLQRNIHLPLVSKRIIRQYYEVVVVFQLPQLLEVLKVQLLIIIFFPFPLPLEKSVGSLQVVAPYYFPLFSLFLPRALRGGIISGPVDIVFIH